MCNRDVVKRYFFIQFTIPNPSKDLFLREKPENGYRIFLLGGSTVAGFPYANNLTFSRILCHQLQDAYLEKHIEVVNLGMATICSYTLHDFMDEVLNQNPDAILKKASKAGVKVMVSELVGNLRDQKPFISVSEKTTRWHRMSTDKPKHCNRIKNFKILKFHLTLKHFLFILGCHTSKQVNK